MAIINILLFVSIVYRRQILTLKKNARVEQLIAKLYSRDFVSTYNPPNYQLMNEKA